MRNEKERGAENYRESWPYTFWRSEYDQIRPRDESQTSATLYLEKYEHSFVHGSRPSSIEPIRPDRERES
jgi:hypothetical protein